ncbi:uncharacterized protein METZ01_LOCUS272129, partial [marine metagenome]
LSDGVVQVPGEVPTIQGAIDAASDGDTVLVAAGTYFENIDFNGKGIAVIGADSSNTIIDGGQNDQVVGMEGLEGSAPLLKGFTIQNGYATGGGIAISGGPAKLHDLVIKNNSSSNDGGGIWATSWTGEIKNSTIRNNSSFDRGGGIKIQGETSQPLIDNVIIANNTTSSTGGDGGGIYHTGSVLTLTGVIINNNTSAGEGGGIFTEDLLTIYSSVISNNSAVSNGGGIAGSHQRLYVFNSTISGNTAATGPGGGFSGVGGWLMMNNVQLTSNTTGNNGGGLYLQTVNTVLNNVTVADNTANNGGGLYAFADYAANIDNSIFFNNSPQELSFSDDAMPNTINVSYSIIEGGEDAIVEYTGDSLYWGSGNMVGDPLFTDATIGDYTLQSSSPAVNAGNPNGFYNDSDGSRNDMGYTGGNGLIVTTFDV